MFNVLKMDLYRMAKSNATWIILLASMLMMFVSIFMTSQDIDYYNSNPIALENLQENGGEINWGIYIGSVNPKWCNGNEISLMDLVAVNIKSKLLLMFLVVFITYFVGSEGRNGFIKNIAGQVRNRSSLILGKFIAIGIFTIVMIVAAVFSTMLGSLIFLGYVNFVGIKQGLIFLVVQILLHIGYGMFILLLFNVTRSSIATMLSGILIAAGILQVVDAILFSIFKGLDSIEGRYDCCMCDCADDSVVLNNYPKERFAVRKGWRKYVSRVYCVGSGFVLYGGKKFTFYLANQEY